MGTASESMGTTTESMNVEPRHSLSLLETTTSSGQSSDEMPLARRSPILFMMLPGVREPARVQEPTSPILFQNPDTTDSLESDSDVSIKTEGYAADTESANEVEYTAEPELYQEEILAICAAQRELNGNVRLALFRMPPKNAGYAQFAK